MIKWLCWRLQWLELETVKRLLSIFSIISDKIRKLWPFYYQKVLKMFFQWFNVENLWCFCNKNKQPQLLYFLRYSSWMKCSEEIGNGSHNTGCWCLLLINGGVERKCLFCFCHPLDSFGVLKKHVCLIRLSWNSATI